MPEKATNAPDHTLAAARVRDGGEEPQIYEVVDLKAYVKPGMDEELTNENGSPASYGAETVCRCVPVELCACNTVTYFSGSTACSCVDHCYPYSCASSKYWFPY